MKFSEKSALIHSLKDQTLELTTEYSAYSELGERIRSSLAEKNEDSKLRIVFVGQYSSGKSSIISALTNDSSIKIDSDIATDTTEDYEWRSVIITDTPGIAAGRPDHDAITHKKIQQADLLVYVVTYSLFDNVLVEDFRRLAVDYNYKGKMLLVVNKMYSEDGEYEELCRTYTQNLEEQIGAETLSVMPVSFVSAGYALDEDPDFHPYSHIDDLAGKLEGLIGKNQSLARVETVGQIVATSIEEELAGRVDGTTSDEQQLLQRVEKVVSRVKRDAESLLREEVASIKSLSRSLGSECAAGVGASETIQDEIDEASESLNRKANESFNQLTERFSELDDELDAELVALSESNLAQRFFARYESRNSDVKIDGEAVSIDKESDRVVVKQLSSLLGKGSSQLASLSAGAKAGTGLLTSTGASGSAVHQAVLGVGKALGVKFQGWQAVNIAKNIGNVGKVLGPIAAALPVFFEVVDVVQEEKRTQQLTDGRRKIREGFQDAGRQITEQFESSGREYIDGKYGKLVDEISSMRRARINEADNLEEGGRKLREVSETLRSCL